MVPINGTSFGRPGAGSSSKTDVRPSSRRGSPASRPMRMSCESGVGGTLNLQLFSQSRLAYGSSKPILLRDAALPSSPAMSLSEGDRRTVSELGEDDPLLILVLALAVGVADFAGLISMEEQDLAKPLVGIDFGWQRCSVGDFQGDETFPLRLKGGYIHNNSTARIGGFTHADGQHIARDPKIFNGPGKRKRIGGNYDG